MGEEDWLYEQQYEVINIVVRYSYVSEFEILEMIDLVDLKS